MPPWVLEECRTSDIEGCRHRTSRGGAKSNCSNRKLHNHIFCKLFFQSILFANCTYCCSGQLICYHCKLLFGTVFLSVGTAHLGMFVPDIFFANCSFRNYFLQMSLQTILLQIIQQVNLDNWCRNIYLKIIELSSQKTFGLILQSVVAVAFLIICLSHLKSVQKKKRKKSFKPVCGLNANRTKCQPDKMPT